MTDASRTVSRRGLIAHALATAAERMAGAAQAALDAVQQQAQENMRRAVEARPVLPPGAGSLARFRQTCTRCDDCIRACPPMVIRKAGPETGEHSGYPLLLPDEGPCRLCDGFPCVAACSPGALSPVTRSLVRLGVADVRTADCLLSSGQPCDYCVRACPERPRALAWSAAGPPEVSRERCTGCGECAWICPARAIRVVAGA